MKCEECKFLFKTTAEKKLDGTPMSNTVRYFCRRYPVTTTTTLDYECGEFKPKDDKNT